jgi:hypothetical protein
MSGVTTDYRFAPIPEQLLFDPSIDTTAKCVYAVLLRHGMTPDDCYPSHRRIGELLGMSARSVQRPLRVLEERGWVQRNLRTDDRGDRISDGFHVRTSPADTAHEDAPLAHESAHPCAHRNAPPARTGTRTGEREPDNESQIERDGPATASPPATRTPQAALDHLPKGVDRLDVRNVCIALRDRCMGHHPQRRAPTVTAQWVKDCGTLLNSGPLDIDGFVPTPGQVHAMIEAIFEQLTEREGSRRFCWADQVNSPGALRRHWAKIELELAQRQPGRSTADVADAVAKLRGMLNG